MARIILPAALLRAGCLAKESALQCLTGDCQVDADEGALLQVHAKSFQPSCIGRHALSQCEKCRSSEQCADGRYCDPYKKMCVHPGERCPGPGAECNPPCYQPTGPCTCRDPDFVNEQWQQPTCTYISPSTPVDSWSWELFRLVNQLRYRGFTCPSGKAPATAIRPHRQECAETRTGDCRFSQCCKEAGKQCYEKNEYWATCQEICTPGLDPMDPAVHRTPWSCKPLGKRTPKECAETNGDCRFSKCCKEAGMQCYEKNQWWAQCKATCRPGVNPRDLAGHQTPWSCRQLGQRTPKAQATSTGLGLGVRRTQECTETRHADCRFSKCCKEAGMQCYEKNSYWAACQDACTPGVDWRDPAGHQTPWSCKPLGQRTPKAGWGNLQFDCRLARAAEYRAGSVNPSYRRSDEPDNNGLSVIKEKKNGATSAGAALEVMKKNPSYCLDLMSPDQKSFGAALVRGYYEYEWAQLLSPSVSGLDASCYP